MVLLKLQRGTKHRVASLLLVSKGKGRGTCIYIAPYSKHSPSTGSGMDHAGKLHYTCLHLVNIHQTAPPLTFNDIRTIAAYYSFIDPERMKSCVGMFG